MSVFQFQANRAMPINVALSDSTATTIVDATAQQVFVAWFEVNETGGGTQNLTVDVYDGTNARILGDDAGGAWNAKAVTAYASLKFSQGYVIPKGSVLRVTSSDVAGKFTVHGIKAEAL